MNQKKRITYLGHAGFKLVWNTGTLLFDPWIDGNPSSPLADHSEIGEADHILVSHDHRDHGFVDGTKISRDTGAVFIGVFELVNKAVELGAKNTLPGNIGGIVSDKDVSVYFTIAHHSSDIARPCGFIAETEDYVIYHAGDTSLFSEMELYGERWKIDLALLPIGSTYTMDPIDAARAVKLLQPKKVIPMHYNTFPQVETDPQVFKDQVKEKAPECEVIVLKPGEGIDL